MADLGSIAGVVQVIFGGLYEGTINDFGFTRPRPITQVAMANRRIARGIGVGKPSVTFTRPVLKVAKGQQVPIEVLDGPIDIQIIMPGGDQQWLLPNFQRGDAGFKNNPDGGNSTENYAGVCDEPVRVK